MELDGKTIKLQLVSIHNVIKIIQDEVMYFLTSGTQLARSSSGPSHPATIGEPMASSLCTMLQMRYNSAVASFVVHSLIFFIPSYKWTLCCACIIFILLVL